VVRLARHTEGRKHDRSAISVRFPSIPCQIGQLYIPRCLEFGSDISKQPLNHPLFTTEIREGIREGKPSHVRDSGRDGQRAAAGNQGGTRRPAGGSEQ